MALAGRVGVILGVANKHSLAWTVAQAWHAAGALVTVSCQNERFDKRLDPRNRPKAAEDPLLLEWQLALSLLYLSRESGGQATRDVSPPRRQTRT